MNGYKILFLNLGYARGIDGRLSQHMLHGYRHLYCPPAAQQKTLRQFGDLIAREAPDICCIVEIDKGSFGSRRLNQLAALQTGAYRFGDITNKYAETSVLRSFALTAGKSNGFIARTNYTFERLSFSCGTKRLIYKIRLDAHTTLLFAHFSLNRQVRARQIADMREEAGRIDNEIILLGDFNVLTGVGEIEPLLSHGKLNLLNQDDPTFFFHRRRRILDLCLCSPGIGTRSELKILPQPYTDHAALILTVRA